MTFCNAAKVICVCLVCWRHPSSFVCSFSEKFITSIPSTNSFLVAELMPVRKRLQGPRYGIYNSCIKKGKGKGRATDGNCCQIAIFLMKRKTQFSGSTEDTCWASSITGFVKSQARAWGTREEREMEWTVPEGAENERTVRERQWQTVSRDVCEDEQAWWWWGPAVSMYT